MMDNEKVKIRIKLSSIIRRWEVTIFGLLIVIFIINVILSPELFRIHNLLDATLTFTEKSIMVLPMTLLIISGVIDISVGSISAMSGVILGVCFKAGIGIWYAAVIGIFVGLVAGFINGLIITKLKIPSIVVRHFRWSV